MSYQRLADAVLLVHFGVVLFIVGGLIAIVVGNWYRWQWVNEWRFRLAHLAGIAFVIIQAWLGQFCPLTTFESWLRVQAGAESYNQSFITYWLQRFIYFEAPFWAFSAAYSIFGLVVLLVWWRFPPRRVQRDEDSH